MYSQHMPEYHIRLPLPLIILRNDIMEYFVRSNDNNRNVNNRNDNNRNNNNRDDNNRNVNNRDSYLRFYKFPKNSEVCRVGCVLFIKPGHHTLHISELKYAPNTADFQVFWKFIKPQVHIHSILAII